MPGEIDILNELLAAETDCLAAHLMRSEVHVAGACAREAALIKEIADNAQEHQAALAELIAELGGRPGLPIAAPVAAGFHFQDLRYLVPQVLVNHEDLIRKCRLASDGLADEPRAVELVSRICANHEEHRAALQEVVDCGEAAPTT